MKSSARIVPNDHSVLTLPAYAILISYYNVNDYRSGTGQTVRMVQKKGLQIINLFRD